MNKEPHYKPIYFWVHLLLFFLISFTLSSQTKPYAEILSNDTSICESGIARLKIQFVGVSPFGIAYEIYENGVYVRTETEIDDPIFSETWETDISVQTTTTIKIVRVYDDTTEKPWDYPGNGNVVSGPEMNVTIYSRTSPSAGDDITAQCGYLANLDATPENENHICYWLDVTGGSFVDKTDPKTTFEADDRGDFTLYFVEENGACKDTASVNIELLGSPKAALSGDATICSTDDISDQITLTVDYQDSFTPYSYTVSDGTQSYDRNNIDQASDSFSIPATGDQTFTITSFSDTRSGKQCFADEADVTGEAIVDDLKPAAYPGEDKIVCGEMTTVLEATLEDSGNSGKWTAESVAFSDSEDPNSKASVTAYGIYDLTWTETEPVLGCKDSNIVKINFAELPNLTHSKDTSICDGSEATIVLNATGNSPWTLAYTIDDITTERQLNAPSEVIKLTPDKTTTVTFDSITGNYGCVTKLNSYYTVTVDEMPKAFAGVYDPVCSNSIQLKAVPSIINSEGMWNGTGTFDDPTSPNTLFTAAGYGEQTLSWTETNTKNKNCVDISLVTIRFDETPEDPYAGKDKKIYLEYSTTLEADPPVPDVETCYGTWTVDNPNVIIEEPNNPDTKVNNLKMGIQTFTWTVVNGVCDAKSDDVTVEVKGLTNPNGFSPNGDGINDFFKIMGATHIPNNQLKVFNRRGKLVYSASNYQNNWDGTNSDGTPLEDGTYYYIFTGDNIDPIKEYLIIKRSTTE
ncbi:MAG: gliding motility-associated C-terminal domain-containing protein [Chlorobi bacterium]|nr:gliding motility-associated C-terminal domain-containing protein [Chlorobiota bacterium]